MITVKTYGGLANRMRVIDSAYQVSQITGHELQVKWEISYELNCSFFSLFEPVPLFAISEYYIHKYHKKFISLVTKTAKSIGINLPFGYDTYIFNKEIENAKAIGKIPNLFQEERKIYLRTVHQFQTADNSFSYFRPIDELYKKILKYKERFAKNTIGIHIRRSDNILSIKNSPREAFVSKMQKAILDEPETVFFLATDSPEEETYLHHAFPNRIISIDKELSRGSERGIQDALVDLYCLANTHKIIGSFYSSFSEVAAQIYHIPLELINISQNKSG
jgi:hypothetical protein